MASKKQQQERRKATFKDREDKHERGFQPQTFKIPKGMSMYQPKAGAHRIDIIPFIAGEGNPVADKGYEYYERTYHWHRNIGPEKQKVVCLRRTFKEACPVCEHRAKLADDAEDNEDLIKTLVPQERQMWLVIDHEEKDKGVQLWEISYHLFGKHLDEKIREADEEDKERYENFADPENGMSLRIVCSEKSFSGQNYIEVTDIEFKNRKEQYEADMASEQPCLDDLLIKMKYAEVKKLFLQIDEAEDDEEDEEDNKRPSSKKSSSGKTSRPTSKDDEEDDDEDDDDEPAPKPKAGSTSSKTGTKKPSSKKEADDDEDEDDDDDEDDLEDEDDEPAPKSVGGIKMGDTVEFEDDRGRTIKGEVVALNKSENNCSIKDSKGKTHPGIDIDEVEKVDEEDDEDEDDEPAPKKPTGKKPVAKKDEEDDEDDEDLEDEEIEVGDIVSFTFKGKKNTKGKVVVMDKDGTIMVQPFNQSKAVEYELEDLTLVSKKEEDDDDD